jgi:hypothetical protein
MRWSAVGWPGALVAVWASLTQMALADESAGGPGSGLDAHAGLFVGKPAALPTGLSTGGGAGFAWGARLAWGAETAWSTATEHSTTHTVRHSDLRLHATGALRRAIGRGSFALRLGAGGTLVHETRRRDQGERAGLTGDDLETSAWRMLPSADLTLVTSLALVGAWGVEVSGGPAAYLREGEVHAGWSAMLGVAWRP